MFCPEVLLVSGDYNFHLDDPSDADARKFMELMDTFGLLQHITTPTHVSGHIFDLIILRSSNDINVFPPKSTYYISDRCFTEYQLSIPGPNMLVKEVSFRKFKQINMDTFRSDIASSVLCNSQWTSLEQLAQCNDTTLSQIFHHVLNVPTPENKFEKFDVLSEEEVSDIIMGSCNASCQLDPQYRHGC